jgi:hypothetical protein
MDTTSANDVHGKPLVYLSEEPVLYWQALKVSREASSKGVCMVMTEIFFEFFLRLVMVVC